MEAAENAKRLEEAAARDLDAITTTAATELAQCQHKNTKMIAELETKLAEVLSLLNLLISS